MSIKYSEPFKEQALKRTKGTTAKDIAESLGIILRRCCYAPFFHYILYGIVGYKIVDFRI